MFKTTKDLLTDVRMKPVGRNRNDLWAAWKEPVAMLRDVCERGAAEADAPTIGIRVFPQRFLKVFFLFFWFFFFSPKLLVLV